MLLKSFKDTTKNILVSNLGVTKSVRKVLKKELDLDSKIADSFKDEEMDNACGSSLTFVKQKAIGYLLERIINKFI